MLTGAMGATGVLVKFSNFLLMQALHGEDNLTSRLHSNGNE